MATTEKKILSVAMESGFHTPCRFYQAFRQVCGMTPKLYRD